jgi:uncharacterized protein
MVQSEKFIKMKQDFDGSIAACRSECEYYPVCGGGNPVLKYEETGTYNATETAECRVHVMAFVDTVLEDINEHFSSVSMVSV